MSAYTREQANLLIRLRTVASRIQGYQAERSQLVHRAYAAGLTLRTIAAAAGKTHPTILRILDGEAVKE